MKITWKRSSIALIIVLGIITALNVITYVSGKNANHDLSEQIHQAKITVASLQEKNKADIETLKEAQETARLVLSEVKQAKTISDDLTTRLETIATLKISIDGKVTAAFDATKSAAESLEQASNVSKDSARILTDLDEILGRY